MDGKRTRTGRHHAGPLEHRTFSETVRLISIERIARRKPDPDHGLRSLDMDGRHRLLARWRR